MNGLDFPWFTVEAHSIPQFNLLAGLVEESAIRNTIVAARLLGPEIAGIATNEDGRRPP